MVGMCLSGWSITVTSVKSSSNNDACGMKRDRDDAEELPPWAPLTPPVSGDISGRPLSKTLKYMSHSSYILGMVGYVHSTP
jgi:hypothetical protein